MWQLLNIVSIAKPHTVYKRIRFIYSLFYRVTSNLFGILFNLRNNLRFIKIVPFKRFNLFLNNLEDNEQSRNNKYLTYHTDEHTSHSSGSQSAVTVSAYSTGKHHRQQTDNHRQ